MLLNFTIMWHCELRDGDNCRCSEGVAQLFTHHVSIQNVKFVVTN